MNEWLLTDFGADGRGSQDDSAAFAAAMDTVAAHRGGRLVVPPGRYRTGTVTLVSDLELEISAGAVIEGSTDPDDYPREATCYSSLPPSCYLFRGRNLQRVRITGAGTIHGHGEAFWKSTFIKGGERALPDDLIHYDVFRPRPRRPAGLFYFTDCEAVTLENITIIDAAAYTVWCIGCREVRIAGVTVRNHRRGPNTDVLDIDCCCDVEVVDCDFEAGDDCIAIKSDPHRTGTGLASERIVVHHCRLSSATCAIRIGYEGDAPICDCRFEDLEVVRSRHGINILSITPDIQTIRIEKGTPIDRLVFRRIQMRDVGQAFFIWAGDEAPRNDFQGHIRDLTFAEIDARGCGGSWIGSAKPGVIGGLHFEAVRMTIAFPAWLEDDSPTAVPSHWGGACGAAGLVLHQVDDVSLRDCRIQVNATPRPALFWTNSPGLRLGRENVAASGKVMTTVTTD